MRRPSRSGAARSSPSRLTARRWSSPRAMPDTKNRGPPISISTCRPSTGMSAPRNLTGDRKGTDTSPVFSPDGRTLAYRSMARAGYEADQLQIVLQPWPAGTARATRAGLGSIGERSRLVGRRPDDLHDGGQRRTAIAVRDRPRRRQGDARSSTRGTSSPRRSCGAPGAAAIVSPCWSITSARRLSCTSWAPTGTG